MTAPPSGQHSLLVPLAAITAPSPLGSVPLRPDTAVFHFHSHLQKLELCQFAPWKILKWFQIWALTLSRRAAAFAASLQSLSCWKRNLLPSCGSLADSDYSPLLGDIFSIHLNNPSRTCGCELTCCVVSLPNRSLSLIKEKSYIFVHKDLPIVFGVPPIKLQLETPGNNSLPSGRRCLHGLPHSFCLVTQFVRTTLFYFLMMILLNFLGLSTESEIFLWSSSDFFLLGNSGKTQAGATEGY